MKSDQELNPIEMMDALIQEREVAILEFKKGGQDLQFEQVLSFGEQYSEIAKGVKVKLERKISENHFVLRCQMEDKAELKLHVHSDYDEEFDVLKGAIFDKESNTFIDKKHLFKKNVWHYMASIGASEMLIHCTKT